MGKIQCNNIILYLIFQALKIYGLEFKQFKFDLLGLFRAKAISSPWPNRLYNLDNRLCLSPK